MILSKNQIYILDDEAGVRISIETILSADGYNVKAFACGKDLVRYMDHETFSAPACALVDLRLPDMSGVAVMTKIKERSPETEVIMLTGNPDMSSAVDSVNAGAYAYILKPYNIDEVKNVLNKILEKQKLLRENRELTEKLKSWNEKLEDEVHRRTVALNDSYKKLQHLYEMRTQFISIMSHEIRTPSTALLGFSDTLRENWQTLSKDKIQQYLDVIGTEAGRMVTLMSEIFEISRIQDGSLRLQIVETDCSNLLSRILSEFRGRHPQFSFSLEEKSGTLLSLVDPLYFKTAFSHVLTNAVKYSGESRSVKVMTAKEGKQCVIRVEDEGPGIAQELRERVFEPFFRSMDDVNRKTPGVGLGLTIARGIIGGMNGTIQIGDKITGGRGCSVTISLPLE